MLIHDKHVATKVLEEQKQLDLVQNVYLNGKWGYYFNYILNANGERFHLNTLNK